MLVHKTADHAKQNTPLLGAILFLLVLAAFYPAVNNGFLTYDDPEYVTANPYVKDGLTWAGIKWAFQAHGANWHPLTWLSHLLDGQLFGLRPWGHHFTSILLHAMNATLAFWVLKKLTGAVWKSFAVALLFGLHPLRVESVAWVAERKDVLSTFFWMLTLLAYAEYVETLRARPRESKFYYLTALTTFALGLLSKSMVVTLPFALLLLDFWPLRRWAFPGSSESSPAEPISWKRLLLEKIPFFALAGLMSLIAYESQLHGSAMVSSMAFPARLANALVGYVDYAEKIFWPAGLAAIYPYHVLPVGKIYTAALLLALVTFTVVISLRHRPYLAVGWFWFLGTLVPVVGLVKIGDQAMADRYTYIPSLGIFIAVVWLVDDWTKNWRQQLVMGTTTTAALAVACLLLTRAQIPYWKNSEALFRRAVEKTTDNTLACVGLGSCLAERGEYDAGNKLYRQALQYSPNYFEAHEDLALSLLATGKLDDAITEFQVAIQCRNAMAEGHLNFGTALARKGDITNAISEIQRAAALDPANPLPHGNLGRILMQSRKFDDAAKEFKLALDLKSDDADMRLSLAEAFFAGGHAPESIAAFHEALRIAPNNPEIHNDLGGALAMTGRMDEAIAEFREALKLNPNHAQAQANLTKALSIKNAPNARPIEP